jgi:hypothetical protein
LGKYFEDDRSSLDDQPGDRIAANVRDWLKADLKPPEIDFRCTPNNGHSHDFG